MLTIDGKMDVFLKRVASVAGVPQQDHTPEVNDNGRMMFPVDLTEHRCQKLILSYARVKCVDKVGDVFAGGDIVFCGGH